jgi:hypothetical protein
MNNRRRRILLAAVLAVCAMSGAFLGAQSKGLRAIRADDMKFAMKFLSAPEFRGRGTPSPELDLAARYIALTASSLGLKPLMPDGAFTQDVPVEITTVSPTRSYLRLAVDGRERRFPFGGGFGVGRYAGEGDITGSLVFLGLGVSAKDLNWDDYGSVDLKGKIAVIMDVSLPREHPLKPEENRHLLMGRAAVARDRGAAAIVAIINEEREKRLAADDLPFDSPRRLRFPDVDTSMGTPARPGPAGERGRESNGFLQVEVRHAVAARLLGFGHGELERLFADVRGGKRVGPKEIPGRKLEIVLRLDRRREKTENVVAWAEGRDPELKKEYVVIGSHYDHLGTREGRIFPGADDNVSGVAAMFAIARAVAVERPKRSIVFVWHTAEERGLIGAYYFVEHCPVPVEKISADLNLDMISRNDPGHLFLIGANKLSTELDESIQAMNSRGLRLKLDYQFEDPAHRERLFFRSDQFPYIRYGIPGVWFFGGTTEDYHREGDIESKVSYEKMEKVARLAYLVAMDIGNKPALLRLDLDPKITERGKRNLSVDWRPSADGR